MTEENKQPMLEPVKSHALKAVANYLGKKNETRDEEGLSEGDALLETLFFQLTLILNAVNSSVTLSNEVSRAMNVQVARLKGEEPAPVQPEESKIIIPSRFSSL